MTYRVYPDGSIEVATVEEAIDLRTRICDTKPVVANVPEAVTNPCERCERPVFKGLRFCQPCLVKDLAGLHGHEAPTEQDVEDAKRHTVNALNHIFENQERKAARCVHCGMSEGKTHLLDCPGSK